jgi:dTDP-4-amino-4,6-dideoxygalactose transaminase
VKRARGARRARRSIGDPIALEGGTPIRRDFLPFGRPLISEDEIAAVADVLRSGWIGMGRRTIEFETAFARYVGARHAISVSSCTAGLHAALVAAGIGPGHEVITTPLTFAATVNAILDTGASPVLVDVDPRTLDIEPAAVRRALSRRTRAILPVHFGGLACDLGGLGAIAAERNLIVLEDAAHAVGAQHGGKRVGGHGNLVAFSFYPNKNMTTIEGGMVTTDDDRLAEEIRLVRLHGLSSDAWRRFSAKEIVVSLALRGGFKYNLTDVQSVLGLGQLARIEEFLATRERYAVLYDRAMADLPVDLQVRPSAGSGHRHALHLYVILLRLDELSVDRNMVLRALRAENVGAGLHYQAIHEHPYFAAILPHRAGDFPVAESVSERTLTLPLGPSMSEEDVEDVILAVQSVLARYRRRARAAGAKRPRPAARPRARAKSAKSTKTANKGKNGKRAKRR